MLIGQEIFVESGKVGGFLSTADIAVERVVHPGEFKSEKPLKLPVPKGIDGLSFFDLTPTIVGVTITETVKKLSGRLPDQAVGFTHHDSESLYLYLLNGIRYFGAAALKAQAHYRPSFSTRGYREFEIKNPFARIDQTELTAVSPYRAMKMIVSGEAARLGLWGRNFNNLVETTSLTASFGLHPDLDFPNDIYTYENDHIGASMWRYFSNESNPKVGLEIQQVIHKDQPEWSDKKVAIASIVYSPFRHGRMLEQKYGG